MASPVWDGFIIAPYGTMGEAQTDADILAAARTQVSSIFHPVSTAKMTKKGTVGGVVDPDLTVKGTTGLRVVDASIFVSVCAACAVLYADDVCSVADDSERASECCGLHHGRARGGPDKECVGLSRLCSSVFCEQMIYIGHDGSSPDLSCPSFNSYS